MKQRVDVITLGCSKNLVDSERLLKMLQDEGFDPHHDPDEADATLGATDIVVVNTCGFIGDAKEESINTILRYAMAKKEGLIRQLYVMGCLSQRYSRELPPEIPEVDAWFGKFDWAALIERLTNAKAHTAHGFDRVITTPPHTAYLKIAEGCNRFCAFCAIPIITGRYHSRPIDEIVDEVESLVAKGVKEFNVIAQDLSAYGEDIYGENRLPELIDRIALIPGVEWIRLHYAYPAGFPMALLDVMARHDNVCKYIDIALQHASDNMLSRMLRKIDAQKTARLLDEMRRRVPGLHIRTTMMVGFPGESDDDFEQLLDFVSCQRFERLGAFAYCEEDDTFAARNYTDDVPPTVKQQRLSRLMALQEQIALEQQNAKVGTSMRVIIDREEPQYYVGRSQWDSPEVDPEVLVEKTRLLAIGGFYDVTVTEAMPFELIAKISDD